MSEHSMHRAIRKLREEHRSISAVLSGLRELARMAEQSDARPDLAAARAMIYYIDTFPERLHHPKEDEHLFARLVRELERAVLSYEQAWPQGGEAFRRTVETYADFHWRHMRKEELTLGGDHDPVLVQLEQPFGLQAAQVLQLVGEVGAEVEQVRELDGFHGQAEVAGEPLDHGAPREVVRRELDAARHR